MSQPFVVSKLTANHSGKRGAASNTLMFLCGGRLPMTTQNIWTMLAWMKPSFGICSLMFLDHYPSPTKGCTLVLTLMLVACLQAF